MNREGRGQRAEDRGRRTESGHSGRSAFLASIRLPACVLRPLASNPRSGQAVVFLLLAFTALIFVLLFNVDLHRIIQRKDQTQNAGDAAALAAARWQGATLNLVGELNLLHVLALATQTPAAVDAITNMQARLCFTGPLTALMAAQIAAKNNHIYVDPDMTTLLTEHAATIRTQYTSDFNGEMYFPEPWPGAWNEYSEMLGLIASDGIAAGPDNARFYLDPSAGHLLLTKAFYEAVEGRSWCWFFYHASGMLENYNSVADWPALPGPDANDYADSEIFGIGLHPFVSTLKHFFSTSAKIEPLIDEADLGPASAAALAATNVMDSVETWYVYNQQTWTAWDRIKPGGESAFPITGPVRPWYDYAGADTVVRVYASVDRMTPSIDGGNRSDKVVWTAAAKPFGYLETDTEKERPTAASDFVIPAFRDVRLIPIDAASGSENSSSDIVWVRHIKSHLQPYLDGVPTAADCRYCRALTVWDNAAFRKEGVDWLALYSGNCFVPSGGGGRGGGTRRGH